MFGVTHPGRRSCPIERRVLFTKVLEATGADVAGCFFIMACRVLVLVSYGKADAA